MHVAGFIVGAHADSELRDEDGDVVRILEIRVKEAAVPHFRYNSPVILSTMHAGADGATRNAIDELLRGEVPL